MQPFIMHYAESMTLSILSLQIAELSAEDYWFHAVNMDGFVGILLQCCKQYSIKSKRQYKQQFKPKRLVFTVILLFTYFYFIAD